MTATTFAKGIPTGPECTATPGGCEGHILYPGEDPHCRYSRPGQEPCPNHWDRCPVHVQYPHRYFPEILTAGARVDARGRLYRRDKESVK